MTLRMEPQSEIEALREQLHECEDVCRALRSGEVDAVVVDSSVEHKRVLLMSGAYARYRQIVEDMEQGTVTLTASGEILFANHAFADMVKQPLLDVFRTPLSRYVAAEHRGKLDSLLLPRARARETVVELHDTGIPVRLSLVSASDDFTTVLVTRIGERRQSDEAMETLEAIRRGAVDAFVVDDEQVVLLENAQTPYRAVVEHMHEGAALLDEEGQIAYANEQFLSTLGAPLATLRGKALLSFVPLRDQGALQSLLDAREAAQADLRLNRSNGDTLAMHVTMTRLDGHRLMLFRDTTLQKRHQASDERTRKFLSMLAHEFRNILAPISSSTQYLSQVNTLDPQSRKAVETIARQSERLLGLVEDLRRVNPTE
jgi:PAS domain S-box-containing protein